MIRVLRIADLNIRECIKMQKENTRPFAVIGNRTRIPLLICVPCEVDVQEDPLKAVQETIEQLQSLAVELEATEQHTV